LDDVQRAFRNLTRFEEEEFIGKLSSFDNESNIKRSLAFLGNRLTSMTEWPEL